MNKREKAILKQIITAIKIPRQCDIPTANAAYNSPYYDEQIIKPLEKLCDWNKEDEQIVIEQAIQLKKETENGRFQERLNKIKEFFVNKKFLFGSIITLAARIRGGAFIRSKKKNH